MGTLNCSVSCNFRTGTTADLQSDADSSTWQLKLMPHPHDRLGVEVCAFCDISVVPGLPTHRASAYAPMVDHWIVRGAAV